MLLSYIRVAVDINNPMRTTTALPVVAKDAHDLIRQDLDAAPRGAEAVARRGGIRLEPLALRRPDKQQIKTVLARVQLIQRERLVIIFAPRRRILVAVEAGGAVAVFGLSVVHHDNRAICSGARPAARAPREGGHLLDGRATAGRVLCGVG